MIKKTSRKEIIAHELLKLCEISHNKHNGIYSRGAFTSKKLTDLVREDDTSINEKIHHFQKQVNDYIRFQQEVKKCNNFELSNVPLVMELKRLQEIRNRIYECEHFWKQIDKDYYICSFCEKKYYPK